MFPSTLIVFVTIISISQGFIVNNQHLECPFVDINNNYCTRSSAFISFLAEHPQQRNKRPDVSSTSTDVISDYLCCYEEQCLRECEVFESLIDNQLSKDVTFFAPFFVEYSSTFFESIDKNELQQLRNRLASSELLVQWKIKMAHYYQQAL